MPRKQTNFIVIHCAATKPSMDIDAKTIDHWHRSRGFLKIGYHFVIKRDGTVEIGRELEEVGAHVKSMNRESIGICMVGGVTQEDHKVAEDNFTEDQWVSLYTLIQDMMGEYPMAKVIGHNEVSSKFCPSFDVQAWLINNGLIDGKDSSENKSED